MGKKKEPDRGVCRSKCRDSGRTFWIEDGQASGPNATFRQSNPECSQEVKQHPDLRPEGIIHFASLLASEVVLPQFRDPSFYRCQAVASGAEGYW